METAADNLIPDKLFYTDPSWIDSQKREYGIGVLFPECFQFFQMFLVTSCHLYIAAGRQAFCCHGRHGFGLECCNHAIKFTDNRESAFRCIRSGNRFSGGLPFVFLDDHVFHLFGKFIERWDFPFGDRCRSNGRFTLGSRQSLQPCFSLLPGAVVEREKNIHHERYGDDRP